MRTIGIDPGLTGAIVGYAPEGLLIYDFPTVDFKGRRRADVPALLGIFEHLYNLDFRHAALEHVNGVAGQGAGAAFQFGYVQGAIYTAAIARGIDVRLVPPPVWKRDLSVRADKTHARQIAQETFVPHAQDFARVKDHGRAEAALLAWWLACVNSDLF